MKVPLKNRLDKLEEATPKAEPIEFVHFVAVEPGTMKETLAMCWPMPHAKAKGLRCEECGQDGVECEYDQGAVAA